LLPGSGLHASPCWMERESTHSPTGKRITLWSSSVSESHGGRGHVLHIAAYRCSNALDFAIRGALKPAARSLEPAARSPKPGPRAAGIPFTAAGRRTGAAADREAG